jgi:hypothetical protein
MIENDKKMAAVLGVLPVLMDFIEDIKEQYPKVYSKRVKKTGNDFLEEANRHLSVLFSRVRDMEGSIEFYDEVQNISTAFMQWLDTEPNKEDK